MLSQVRGRVSKQAVLPWVVLTAVLLLGVCSRLPRLADPPLTYHPTRQYLSGLLARDFLANVDPDVVDVSPKVAAATRLPLIEPPIMETLAVGGFLVTGEQSWWLPRSLSLGFWGAAAVVVFLIGRRCRGVVAGVVGAAVVMLNPGTTEVARSFQPESLLVFCIALAALLLLRASEADASRVARAPAALVVGVAVLVKITAALVLLPLAVLTALHWRRRVRALELAALGALAALPTALYYAYGFFWGGFLTDQAGGRILPRLLSHGWFWSDWALALSVVVPVGLLAVGVLGALVGHGALRRLTLSLLLGYVALGLTFTYHISSHDYYSAPVVLPVALGTGSAADWLVRHLDSAGLRRVATASLVALMLLACAAQVTIARGVPSSTGQISVSRQIGAALPAGTPVVVLAPSYGFLLRFYGGLPGRSWPYRYDIRYEHLQGLARLSEKERLLELAANDADYFVVADLDELDRQPALRSMLSRFPIFRKGSAWRIYAIPDAARE